MLASRALLATCTMCVSVCVCVCRVCVCGVSPVCVCVSQCVYVCPGEGGGVKTETDGADGQCMTEAEAGQFLPMA